MKKNSAIKQDKTKNQRAGKTEGLQRALTSRKIRQVTKASKIQVVCIIMLLLLPLSQLAAQDEMQVDIDDLFGPEPSADQTQDADDFTVDDTAGDDSAGDDSAVDDSAEAALDDGSGGVSLDFFDDAEVPEEPSQEDQDPAEPEELTEAAEPVEVPEVPAETGLDAVDIDALTTAPVKVKGKVNAALGMGIGITDWPGSSGASGEPFSDLVEFYGYFDSSAEISIDARPLPYLRFYTSIMSEVVEDAADEGETS
ncbi:MAG: hypothetical protein K9K78_07965, partial [Spirochaetales bacterium]|nr:hypothetical protein [Spirochaetales bacterium]